MVVSEVTQKNANKDLFEMAQEELTDRQYNAKFKSLYNRVRKGLVILNARKVTKKQSGKALYDETIDFLSQCLNINE